MALDPAVSIVVRPGEPRVVDVPANRGSLAVVFEDDGETGYLYALDHSRSEGEEILDALMVYEVTDVPARREEQTIDIRWTEDGTRAALALGGEVEAVIDFARRRACCRSGFPPADGTFASTHDWDEELARPFRRL